MKSIIINLLKQSYDFFAVALTTGFIFSFFFPIKHFLLFTIGVVIADTITGIKAARKEGKAITSKGLYRTTEKIVVYFTSILIFHGAQLTFAIPVPIVCHWQLFQVVHTTTDIPCRMVGKVCSSSLLFNFS